MKNQEMKIRKGEDQEDNESVEEEEKEMKDIQKVTESRTKRIRKMLERYNDYQVHANFCDVNIPKIYEEAIRNSDLDKWKEKMNEEIMSLEDNNTWNLFQEPLDKKIIEAN